MTNASSGEVARRDHTIAMVRGVIADYEAAVARLARLEEASDGPDWAHLRNQLEGDVCRTEAGVAYAIEAAFAAIAPHVPPVTDGPFEAFGVIVDGTIYGVRFDPANMDHGIIGRFATDRLVDLSGADGTPASGPDPIPSDPEGLARYVTRKCIRDYHEAVALERHCRASTRNDPGRGDPWGVLAGVMTNRAEESLLTAIQAFDPSFRDWNSNAGPRLRRPSRGVRSGGRVYLSVPEDEDDPAEEHERRWLMRLAIVEADSVADLDVVADA